MKTYDDLFNILKLRNNKHEKYNLEVKKKVTEYCYVFHIENYDDLESYFDCKFYKLRITL